MKKFVGEFKTFITRGNVLDMAIGVIVGGAFNTIVTTMNSKILMPVINWVLSYISGNGSGLYTILPNSKLLPTTFSFLNLFFLYTLHNTCFFYLQVHVSPKYNFLY